MRYPCLSIPLLLLLSGLTGPAGADTAHARCDIYPKGSDQASATLACDFSQRQGYVTITRADGVVYDLRPVGDSVGNYTDADGKVAYRQSGLGRDGLIFRLANESVYVYWDRSGLPSDTADPDSPTAPYTTAHYDAVMVLDCSFGRSAEDQDCPAGVHRGDAGSASLRIMKPDGEERVLNFEGSKVSTPDGGKVSWERIDYDWKVRIDEHEFYFVPDAAVVGG